MSAMDSSSARHVWLRLVADPQSVPAARRFARDAVTQWRRLDLLDDVALCISELTTNAALHSGSDYLELALLDDEHSVSIIVDDHATATAAGLVRASGELAAGPGPVAEPDGLASTGRGLLLVAALARQWGIEETPTGKRIWARLSRDDEHYEPTPPTVGPMPADPLVRPRLPTGWHMLRLTGCPVQLALAHSQRLDDLLRELQLVDSTDGDQPQALATVIDRLLHGQGHARQLGRHLLQDAGAQGMDRVDIELPLPPGAAERLGELDQALAAADALCRQGHLLTLASTPDMLALRAWVEHEVTSQIQQAQQPLPYNHWLRSRPLD